MKKTKYIVMLIISLLLIAGEVVGFMLVALPYMKVDLIYEAVVQSNQDKAEKLSKNLDDKTKEKTVTVLNDYSAYIVEQYDKKKMSFDDADGHFKAMVVSNGSFDIVLKNYDSIINSQKAIEIVDKAYPEIVKNEDSLTLDDYAKEFLACINYQPVCKKETEDIVKAYITQKYDAYLAGTGDFETARIYAKVGKKLSANGSQDFYADLANLSDTLELIAGYEQDMQTINEYRGQKNYLEAIAHADTVLNVMQSDTTGYLEKIKNLRAEVYEEGKNYYPSYVQELVNGGDYKTAKELVAKLELLYANDIDLTALKDMVKEPWKKAYENYLANWDANLANDVAAKNKISDYDELVNYDYNQNKPESIFLHDFDGNGTLEMLLADSQGDDKYWYLFGIEGTSCKFLGAVLNATIISDGRIIMKMTNPGEEMEGYEVLKINGAAIAVETYVIRANDGSKYIVDGQEVELETVQTKINEINALIEGELATVGNGAYMENAIAFVDKYGEE